MLRIVLIPATGLAIFAISAALSWNLHRTRVRTSGSPVVKKEPERQEGNKAALDGNLDLIGAEHELANADNKPSGPLPVNVRPEYVPGTEEVLQLAADLKKRMEALQRRETEIENKLARLKIVYQDIRNEQQVIDELKKQVQLELQAVTDQINKLETKFAELQRHAQEKAEKIQELEKRIMELDEGEMTNIRRMASIYDTMDADSAARILSKMANEGELATVAALLSAMKERQAAKVLAALPDASLAVQLSEHLKRLKQKQSSGGQ